MVFSKEVVGLTCNENDPEKGECSCSSDIRRNISLHILGLSFAYFNFLRKAFLLWRRARVNLNLNYHHSKVSREKNIFPTHLSRHPKSWVKLMSYIFPWWWKVKILRDKRTNTKSQAIWLLTRTRGKNPTSLQWVKSTSPSSTHPKPMSRRPCRARFSYRSLRWIISRYGDYPTHPYSETGRIENNDSKKVSFLYHYKNSLSLFLFQCWKPLHRWIHSEHTSVYLIRTVLIAA